MVRLLASVMLSTLAIAQSPAPGKTSEREVPSPVGAPVASTPLPPAPAGRSTVIGGEIRDVDPVRDRFRLKIFGGQTLTILFDERTQVYRDGVKIRVLDLHPEDHGSVETTLDGTKIFALRIHMLSQLPPGECQGQVSSYNLQTGELTVKAALSQEPITLLVPAGTPVLRVGDGAFTARQGGVSDLTRGSLVNVTFKAGTGGHGVASKVDILAIPGSAFRFRGKLSFVDSHAGRLVLVDPRDDQAHQISYDPARFPVSRELREGQDVSVSTTFDGSQYVASEITTE